MDNNVKKKVIIHIGMGRCGSSTVQHLLHGNSARLGELGISYPIDEFAGVAHHELAPLRIEEISAAEKKWESIIKNFDSDKCYTLLLSSEYFIAIPEELIKFIYNILKKYNVEIIFITKHQAVLLPSIFAHWYKSGIIYKDFSAFFQLTREEWRYSHIVKRWSDLFGVENLKCRILSKNDDATEIFIKCLNNKKIKKLVSEKKQDRLNKSFNEDFIKLLSLFDQVSKEIKPLADFPGWDKIEPISTTGIDNIRLEFIALIEKISTSEGFSSKSFQNNSMTKEITDYYRESNTEFHNKYLKDKSIKWIENEDVKKGFSISAFLNLRRQE